MPATGGMDLNQLGDKSLLRLVTDVFTYPRAADDDFCVVSVDPNGVTVGTALTLTAAAGKSLRHPRRVTLTVTDNSYSAGAPLNILVRVVGHRNGRLQTEDLSVTTTDGNATEVVSDKLFEQVTSATLIQKTNAAASDAIKLGIAGTALGLKYKIRSINDVVSITEIDAGTEQTGTAISTTTIDPDQSCLQGITIVATDIWEVKYLARVDEGIGSAGAYP
jgi:hypothetical protein